MRIREHSGGAAAILLLAAAVLLAFGLQRSPSPPAPVLQPLARASPPARAKMEWCLEHVTMVHDLHWAVACMKVAQEGQGDDLPDCTLPDDRARPLNAARGKAEQQCFDEAAAAR